MWASSSIKVPSSLRECIEMRIFRSSCACVKYHPDLCPPFIHSVSQMILLADTEVPDQTARMRALISAFAVRICPKTNFRMAQSIWYHFSRDSFAYKIRLTQTVSYRLEHKEPWLLINLHNQRWEKRWIKWSSQTSIPKDTEINQALRVSTHKYFRRNKNKNVHIVTFLSRVLFTPSL